MRSQFGRAVVGGLVGTIAMTLMMMFVAPMMGVHMDIAKSLAGMMGSSHAVGLAVHFLNGTIIFPAIFVFLLLRILPGTTLVKGLIWGGILWAMLEILVMPMMGMGVFGSNGPGMKGAVAALLAHLVYGALLGGITSWKSSSPALTANA
jgi:uncharacterized membrane protein YagU involved in acid resistance